MTDRMIIASRVLTLPSDKSKAITVDLGLPRQVQGQDHYSCPYWITGPGVGVARCAYGLDAMQSLQLALAIIGAELSVIEARWGGALEWCDGGTGFP